MGETIGSCCYVEHTFAVKGFGEVNKKSLEGYAAVFYFSVGGTSLSAFVIWLNGLSLLWKGILPLFVAALSMVTETVAFRSKDNFVIPVCNTILVTLTYNILRDEC